MGSSTSKAARTAGTAAARKYPSRTPPTSTTQSTPQATANAKIHATELNPEDTPGPSVHPDPSSSYAKVTSSRNEAINDDSSDPDLALNERMRQLGPVQPNPTMSNSSTFNTAFPSSRQKSSSADVRQGFTPSASTPSQSLFPQHRSGPSGPASNPAVILLEARQRLADEAEREFEDVARLGKGLAGRKFLDVSTIRQVIKLRDEMGRTEKEIEDNLQLQPGLVSRLGRPGVFSGP